MYLTEQSNPKDELYMWMAHNTDCYDETARDILQGIFSGDPTTPFPFTLGTVPEDATCTHLHSLYHSVGEICDQIAAQMGWKWEVADSVVNFSVVKDKFATFEIAGERIRCKVVNEHGDFYSLELPNGGTIDIEKPLVYCTRHSCFHYNCPTDCSGIEDQP
jgi:hypothetical protein